MWKFALIILVSLIFVSCGKVSRDSDAFGWRFIKSPNTGICYEVAARYRGYSGFMGMDAVSADYCK